jgi:hypothetical protein
MIDNTNQTKLIFEVLDKVTKHAKRNSKGQLVCTVIISHKTMKDVWNMKNNIKKVLGNNEPVIDTENKQDWNSNVHNEIKELRMKDEIDALIKQRLEEILKAS